MANHVSFINESEDDLQIQIIYIIMLFQVNYLLFLTLSLGALITLQETKLNEPKSEITRDFFRVNLINRCNPSVENSYYTSTA